MNVPAGTVTVESLDAILLMLEYGGMRVLDAAKIFVKSSCFIKLPFGFTMYPAESLVGPRYIKERPELPLSVTLFFTKYCFPLIMVSLEIYTLSISAVEVILYAVSI